MKLESESRKKYEGDYNAAVLEQWKTCVDMANANTEKQYTFIIQCKCYYS